MQNWYALQTKPHKEHQVQDLLSARNVEIYLPCEQVSKPGTYSSGRPFFPTYLFAHVDIDVVGLWSLQYAPGMRRVLMVGEKPVSVDEIVIARLRERLGRITTLDNQRNPINPGDSVKITNGPFSDLEAVFDRKLSPSGRVRVLVYFLDRWARMELDSNQIQRTGRLARVDLVTDGVSSPSAKN